MHAYSCSIYTLECIPRLKPFPSGLLVADNMWRSKCLLKIKVQSFLSDHFSAQWKLDLISQVEEKLHACYLCQWATFLLGEFYSFLCHVQNCLQASAPFVNHWMPHGKLTGLHRGRYYNKGVAVGTQESLLRQSRASCKSYTIREASTHCF